jgi:hypothetical protein
MAGTQAEYSAVANAMLKQIHGDIAAKVPGWEQSFIPADLAPTLAGELSKIAVDTLDAYRANETRLT